MNSEIYTGMSVPNDPYWSEVAGMARALLGEFVAGHQPPPELAALAEGTLQSRSRVFIAVREEQAVGMIAAVPSGERQVELMGLYVKPELRGRYIGQQVAAHCEQTVFTSRRFVLTADERNNVRGTAGVLASHEFKHLGDGRWYRDELSAISEYLAQYHQRCLSFGGGDWAVMLFNDEVTTTSAVTHALQQVFDLGEQTAHEVMYVTHYGGCAPVWCYRTKDKASQMAGQLRLVFRNAGFATQVDVEQVARINPPTLLPSDWPAD